MIFADSVKRQGLGKFLHHREPMSIDFPIVRPNRDTLYSLAVFDLDAGPLTITLPNAGQRFMSMQVIDEDHYTPDVFYGAGSHTLTRDKIGTRYVSLGVRILVDPNDPADSKQVHALQDAITVTQPGGPGHFEAPNWDQTSQKKVRDALLILASTLPNSDRGFGTKEQVDPVRRLILSASASGGNPDSEAKYLNVTPSKNDGKAVYNLTVPSDVPVDGFWSITVYDAQGRFEKNKYDAYSLNNLTAKKSADGSVAVQFGGCDGKIPNCLPTVAGWNYMVRFYRPRKEILNGTWKFLRRSRNESLSSILPNEKQKTRGQQMKIKRAVFGVAVAFILIVRFATTAFGVEGALGRPISGASINPHAALVPPEPGFAVTIGEAYYDGSISGAVPIGNFNINLGINMVASFTPIAVTYIWPTTSKEWNFASTVSFPLAYVDVEANGTLGRFSGRKTDHTFGLFDLAFTPLVASYHISQTDHVALIITVWAPTGHYDPNRLAVLSLNNWTVIPGLAYTKFLPKQNIELTGIWQLQFYTENPATNYQNGVLSDLEATVIKRFKCGAGIGVIGSWIEQLNDDSGPTAGRFHGFSGRAFGVGPIITYTTKVGKSLLDLNARFIPEFGNEKRVQGNLFQFAATLKF